MLATPSRWRTSRDLAYLVAIIGFILALKFLSSPKHARPATSSALRPPRWPSA